MYCRQFGFYTSGSGYSLVENRAEAHDKLWLRARELLKEGCIDIKTFDELPRKRIERILRLQEERLQQQQQFMEEERKKQEREAERKQRFRK